MKKIYFLVLSLVFGLSMKAQFTLTSAQNPVIGDVEKTWELDTANLNIGSSGVSQIWNYTGVTITPSVAVNSNSYVSQTAAPNYTIFPAAVNMAQTSDANTYGMASYTTNGITFFGFTNPTLTVIYQDPQRIITLPFTYGNIATDTYSTSYTYQSIPVTSVGSLTTTADGMGTLNTPNSQSFPNVMRIKLQVRTVDTFSASFTNTTVSEQYIYINSSSKFALLSVQVSTTTSNTSTTVTKSKNGNISDMILQSIKEQRNPNANFAIYPNPTNNGQINLHYVLGTPEHYKLTVYNALGQKVKQIDMGQRQMGLYYDEVNLSELPSGVYYLNLKGDKQEGTQKLIKQ